MKNNSNDFFEELYFTYSKKLFLYASATLKNQELSKDVVQDTFHEALRHRDVLLAHTNPGGWLMNTLKNKLKETERARKRDLCRFLSLEIDFPDTDDLPEALVTSHSELEEKPVIEKIRDTLSFEEYQFLERFVFGQASHLEMANEFGISVYASQKRLERIREKLYLTFPERKKRKSKKRMSGLTLLCHI